MQTICNFTLFLCAIYKHYCCVQICNVKEEKKYLGVANEIYIHTYLSLCMFTCRFINLLVNISVSVYVSFHIDLLTFSGSVCVCVAINLFKLKCM